MLPRWALYTRTDPYQNFVIVWFVILILLLSGGVALYFGYTADLEHAEKAGQLRVYGWWLIVSGCSVYSIKCLIRWWVNR